MIDFANTLKNLSGAAALAFEFVTMLVMQREDVVAVRPGIRNLNVIYFTLVWKSDLPRAHLAQLCVKFVSPAAGAEYIEVWNPKMPGKFYVRTFEKTQDAIDLVDQFFTQPVAPQKDIDFGICPRRGSDLYS